MPPLSLLDTYEKKDQEIQQQSLIMNSRLLEKKLKDFGVEGQVTGGLSRPGHHHV